MVPPLPLPLRATPALRELALSLERASASIEAGRPEEIAPLQGVPGEDAGLSAIAAAADRLVAAVRRAHALEAAVHELFEALSSHLRLDYLGYEALYRVVEHTGASGGAIMLLGDGRPDVVAALEFDPAPEALAAMAAQAAGTRQPVQLAAPGATDVTAVTFVGDTGPLGVVLLAGVVLDDDVSRLLALLARALGFAVSNAVAHAAAESRASTDALTGCRNRRAGWAALEQATRVAAHGGPPVGVLMIDLDHFKRINDTHGHQAGDEVLRAVGRAVSGSLRDGDIVMRYGGEEFAVAVTGADDATLRALGERLRGRIAALEVTAEGRDIAVTASVGVAPWAAGEPVEALVGRADRALYAAKAAGRDRVVCQTA